MVLRRSGHAKVSKESLIKNSQVVSCNSLYTLSDRCNRGLLDFVFALLLWLVPALVLGVASSDIITLMQGTMLILKQNPNYPQFLKSSNKTKTLLLSDKRL